MDRYFYTLLLLVFAFSTEITAQNEVDLEIRQNGSVDFFVEGCNENSVELHFSFTEDLPNVAFVGTGENPAVLGEDFEIVETRTEDNLLVTVITIIADGIAEGTETFSALLLDSANDTLAAFELQILDAPEITIVSTNIDSSNGLRSEDEIEVCQRDLIQLTTDPPCEFVWLGENNDTLGIGPSVNVRPDRPVEVRAEGLAGTCPVVDAIQLNLESGFEVDGGDTIFICLGSPEMVRLIRYGSDILDFVWEPNDTTIEVLPNGNATVNPEVTTTYTIIQTSLNCINIDSVVIRVDSLPDSLPIMLFPEKDCYCPGERLTMTSPSLLPTDHYPDVTYSWQLGGGLTPITDTNDLNIIVETNDTTNVRRVTTNNACEITDTIDVIVPNPPVNLSFTDSMVCPGASVDIALLNFQIFDKIEWSPEECVSSTELPAVRVENIVQSKTITVMVEQKECPFSASANINLIPDELIPIDIPDIVCPGEEFQVTALVEQELAIFRWDGTNVDFSCTDCLSPTLTTNSNNNSFLFIGEKPDGCRVAGAGAVNVIDLPAVSLGCEGELFIGSTITVFDQTATIASQYSWTVNGQALPSGESSIEVLLEQEQNSVQLDIVTADGCMISGGKNITAVRPPEPVLPNAFTPESEENRMFRPVIQTSTGGVPAGFPMSEQTTYQFVDMKIFNRWGQKVFETTDADGWDGRIDGNFAETDVYAYTFTYEGPDGNQTTLTGDVTLIRGSGQ